MYILYQYIHNNNERMGKMEIIYKICLVFTILGAVNWGLVGLFDFNLVTAIFEAGSMIVFFLSCTS